MTKPKSEFPGYREVEPGVFLPVGKATTHEMRRIKKRANDFPDGYPGEDQSEGDLDCERNA